jgi:uncharacterized membrane protein YbhN (UPF0104 family)
MNGVEAVPTVDRKPGFGPGRVIAFSRTRWFRLPFGGLLALFATWAVLSEWSEVRTAVRQLDARWVVLAALGTVVNVALAGMVWRTVLADLGSTLALPVAARIFFVGQLGKYLPGSVWPVVMQTELGRDHRIPTRRTMTVSLVAQLLSFATALLVAVLVLPLAPDALPDAFDWAAFLVIPLAVLLHPAVLGAVVDAALRLVGRVVLEDRTTLRGTLLAALWAIGSWVGAGVQVWALSVPLGAPAELRTCLLLIGGYGLAWSVGSVAFVAPAGAGARELALAAVLAPMLDRHGAVVVVVLLSRVLFTLVDLAAAGIGLLVGHAHRPRNVSPEDDPGGGSSSEKTSYSDRQAAVGSGESV